MRPNPITTNPAREKSLSDRPTDDLEFALASLKRAENEAEELRTRLQIAEGKLKLIESSAGWRVILRYRRWLRRNVWSLPGVARFYEKAAGLMVRTLSGASPSDPKIERIPNAEIIEEGLSGGDLVVCCDWPPASGPARALGLLKVQGWAVARSGIKAVRVSIDSSPPAAIDYGLERADVGTSLSDYSDALHSGFFAAISVERLAVGVHRLQIFAETVDGRSAKIVRSFRVDGRDPYRVWIAENEPPRDSSTGGPSFAYEPLLSIVTPVYKTPLAYLTRCVESVRAQTYERWELILVDDCSSDAELAAALEDLANADGRIRVRSLAENSGIAVATNAAIEIAEGEYVGFLDHDDELAPFALEEVVAALNGSERPDALYSDEDKITTEGVRFEPFFKPQFSADLLRSNNYACHFTIVRRELLRELGGLRAGFDGAQDHDLMLRLSERTDKIQRVPRILYHWRAVAGSTALDVGAKPRAAESAKNAIAQHLERLGAPGDVEQIAPMNFRVRYRLPSEPAVLIVMPTGGNMPRLTEAVESVLADTRYSNYRLAVADNSDGSDVREYCARFADDPRATVVDFRGQPFNFSRLCNRAAAIGEEPLVLFLNDDVKVNTPGWLRAMAELATQPGVGAVGARLLFPDGKIQHAGVTLGIFGCAGHAFRGLPGDVRHYFGFADVIRDCAAVTGACLMTPRRVFDELGGFDEVDLPVAFQDVDYCLKAVAKGLRVIYTPFAELYHFESASKENRHLISHPRETGLMHERWGALIEDDPFYNPNLTRLEENFDLRING